MPITLPCLTPTICPLGRVLITSTDSPTESTIGARMNAALTDPSIPLTESSVSNESFWFPKAFLRTDISSPPNDC